MYSEKLFPYPTGWYCVALASELPPGTLVGRTLAGRELVLFRTQGGELGALDAHCPHLGAHLAHGGRVVGEALQCPFHGFCFDTRGACVRTGYDTRPPPTAVARTWQVRERHGLVLVHFDAEGAAPGWELPEVDEAGWSPLHHRRVRLRGHVQEVAENSVDIGHFRWIHGFERVRQLGPLVTEGPFLNLRYAMAQPRRVLGRRTELPAEFEIHQWGLGYARVEVEVPSLGVRQRQFVLAVPLDEDHLELTLAVSSRAPERVARRLPAPLARWVAGRIAAAGAAELERAVRQDVPIWAHKQYVHPPALAQGDGPVGAYRQWVKQFTPASRRREVAAG